jgi:multisubunit Na+/H+ antiporter MnhG subunit
VTGLALVGATLLTLTAGLAVAGVLVARDGLDGLHFLGPLAHLGSLGLLLTAVAAYGWDARTGRVVLIVLVLQVAAPIATHATARAGLARGDVSHLRGHAPDVVE